MKTKSKAYIGRECMLKTVPIEKLKVDDAYQRWIEGDLPSLRRKSEKEGVKAELFGTLLVGQRDDGSLWVVDGQRRLYMAKCAKWASVPCSIFASLGRQHEAEIFVGVNSKRKRLVGVDMLRAAAAGGDQESAGVIATVERCGLSLDERRTRIFPHVSSVDSLKKAYRGKRLDDLCKLIASFANEDAKVRNKAVGSYVVQSLAILLVSTDQYAKEYGTAVVDLERLRKVVRQEMMDVESRCPSRGLAGGNRFAVIARYLVSRYNTRLAGKHKIDMPLAFEASE